MLWQELPGLFHRFQEIFYILTDDALGLFVAFGEYEGERYLPFF